MRKIARPRTRATNGVIFHRRFGPVVCGALLAMLLVGWATRQALADDAADLSAQIELLVAQLDDADAQKRAEAERQLAALAGTDAASTEALLAALPAPHNRMSQEARLRLDRVRQTLESRITDAVAEPSKLSLAVSEEPLADVLAEIEAKTGNRVVDFRDKFGQPNEEKRISIELQDVSFWEALDQVLDAANMTTYAFSGEDAVAIVNQQGAAARRAEAAAQAGPFRLEPIRIEARRGLRDPDEGGLQVEIEVAWEPRLRPVALSQPTDQIMAQFDDGEAAAIAMSAPALDVDVQPGSYASELVVPLQLPSRSATRISSLRGRLHALIPGRTAQFKFDRLASVAQPGSEPVVQRIAGVVVSLDRVRKNNVLWEVHMRIAIESDQTGLDSNRGWIFQNKTFMLDPEGQVLDHLGLETTMQSDREIGFAYLFELPEPIDRYTWIYESPAAITSVPFDYEIKDIPLP